MGRLPGASASDSGDSVVVALSTAEVGVDIEVAPHLPRVLGDANQLEQVLLNLLDNAIRAIDGDGVVRVSRQTKGRKGAGVTVVTGLPLADDALRARERHAARLREEAARAKLAASATIARPTGSAPMASSPKCSKHSVRRR